ncbi:aminotransferase class I/II-fold pyridoxal phosphate-dependent enzyme [Mangrovicoccus algicola]|uniref:Histidinol-phosphate aminotransferase n=1 Tax=Mangrovicoccus algicola TaxID=2771008 RepID=A0A8J6YSR9_9RHOB|nr:aminotransferase class I/II-fold pyridoxal phosphate-dependent enzyme [Mangrovicoccus algicola]MBE3636727.1 aminotransferase class I/II-fold pyridoxal phosphate-dependent enzyme [Mangrovicoccus algicola]
MPEDSLLRPELGALAPYNAGLTIEEIAARPGVTRIAKLGSNENLHGAAPGVAAALRDAAAATHLYPDPQGRRLAARLGEELGVPPGWIVLGDGSEDLLNVIARATLRPGDRVVVLYPSFPLHEDYARMMGAEVIRIGLTAEGRIDIDALAAAMAAPVRLVMIANPMNPAGAWLDPAALDRVLAAQRRDTLLVMDEAYVEYAAHGDFRSAAESLTAHDRPMIVLRTFSKAWGLAALRIGFGATNDAGLRRGLDLVRTPFNTSHLAQVAALAALEDPAHMEAAVAATVAEREKLAAALRGRGLRVLPSLGNFLFLDTGRPSVDVAAGLLDHGVIVKPWKQPGYESWLRVSIGLPEDSAQFLAALQAVLDRPA